MDSRSIYAKGVHMREGGGGGGGGGLMGSNYPLPQREVTLPLPLKV